jgi:hypothetical protein
MTFKQGILDKYKRLGLAGDKPNCGVVTTAYLANTHIKEVTEAFTILRDKPKQWRGMSNYNYRDDIMDYYDVPRKEIEYKSKTLKKWVQCEMDPSKLYLVGVTGHIVIIDRGILIDQSRVVPAIEYFKPRARLTDIMEVLQ